MLYHILYEFLYPLNHFWAPLRVLNVFQYITFRTAYASLTALLISLMLGPWLIIRLREFQIGQHIREEGPKSHQKKAGTPTMGGVLIVVSIIVPTLLWANLANRYVWTAVVIYVIVYSGGNAIFAMLNPEGIASGILLKVFITLGLFKAMQAAIAYQKEQADARSA